MSTCIICGIYSMSTHITCVECRRHKEMKAELRHNFQKVDPHYHPSRIDYFMAHILSRSDYDARMALDLAIEAIDLVEKFNKKNEVRL